MMEGRHCCRSCCIIVLLVGSCFISYSLEVKSLADLVDTDYSEPATESTEEIWIPTAPVKEINDPDQSNSSKWRKENVCRGSRVFGNNPLTLRQMLEDCTVIEGNLNIIWFTNETYDYTLAALPNLYEITGHLVLYRVAGLKTLADLFPNLRVIRGEKLYYQDYAVVLYELSQLEAVSLPKLSYVGGQLLAYLNPELCYMNRVNWTQILHTKKNVPEVHNNNRPDVCELLEQCNCASGVHNARCWDMDHCHRPCSCDQKRITNGCDKNQRCCHDECLGGCYAREGVTAPLPQDCYACKNVFFNGTCQASCPEKLFKFKHRCVTEGECDLLREGEGSNQWPTVFHDKQCLERCPSGWNRNPNATMNNTKLSVRNCVKCDGQCEKVCQGKTIQRESQAKLLRGCTQINGHLEINLSLKGNVTFLEECLGRIKYVSNYVKITRSHFITSLSILRDLQHIGGNKLSLGAAFIVEDNKNLQNIWDFTAHPNLTIEKGKLFFHQNPLLCYKEIITLLNTTTFNGYARNESGIEVKISPQTHTHRDISDKSNGQNGNCFKNSLFLNVKFTKDGPTIALVTFSAFDHVDPRIILGYVIYYREVGEDEVTDYLTGRDMCNSTDVWNSVDIPASDVKQKTNYTQFVHTDPYTRYAFFVETRTLDIVRMNGARSKIIYRRSLAVEPDPPELESIQSVDIGGENNDNIALLVKWSHPVFPNGILKEYQITWRAKSWSNRIKDLNRKDFCDETTRKSPAIAFGTTEASPLLTRKPGECDCENDDQDSMSRNSIDRKEAERKATLRYMLENSIQDISFKKNPEKTSNETNANSGLLYQEKFFNTSTEEVDNLTTILTTWPTTPSAITPATSTLVTSSTVESPATIVSGLTTVASYSTKEPVKPGDSISTEEEIPDSQDNMIVVSANKTEVSIFNLDPFKEYIVEIMACQYFDPVINTTLCSEKVALTGLTRINPRLDRMDNRSFNATPVKINDVTKAINFTWNPPKPSETNGPILAFDISYYKVGETKSRNATATQRLCVQPAEFAANNNSYLWNFGVVLTLGNTYSFSVRVRTMGGQRGGWSKPVTLSIEDPNAGTPLLAYILPSVSVVVLLIAVIGGVLFYLRQKRKRELSRVPLQTLYNSVNPEYFNTDDVYTPDEWEVDRSKVKIKKELGKGSFGMVFEGEALGLLHIDDPKKWVKVAVKSVNDGASIKDKIDFLNEASTMKAFNCHHIVKLLGVVSQGQPVFVIMELMAQGDLKNYLRMHRPDEPDNDGRPPPTLREILRMAAEICDGMAYLAAKKFVHRDLAARNCMVAGDMTVKIGDFGMTRDIYETDYYRKGSKGFLPVRWMSPESLRDGVYTSQSDVWSYGVVLWEMATLAAQPYPGFANEQVLKFVVDNGLMEMPDGCPKKLYDLMKRCWQYYPKQRPTFGQILESIQGDLMVSFFSISWYYTHRDNDTTTEESVSIQESEEYEDEDALVLQPLNPASRETSPDVSSIPHYRNDGKLSVDVPNIRQNGFPPGLTNGNNHTPPDHVMLNGHDSPDNTDSDNICMRNCITPAASYITENIKRKPSSNGMSDYPESDNAPPTYKSNWSSDGSKGSCNGSGGYPESTNGTRILI